MNRDRCPSCDIECRVTSTDEGTQRYEPIGYRPIGSRPCPVCGAPLCCTKHTTWPKEHPYPPECDLWFGHAGMHRQMGLVPTREDHIWGTGELTWEHGRLVRTRTIDDGVLRIGRTRALGGGPVQEYFEIHEPNGVVRTLSDFLPDGAWAAGAEGTITITIDIQPKTKASG